MVVYLVPTGRSRCELYSETPDESLHLPDERAGRLQRWMHAISVQWHAVVEQARRGHSPGRFARWRDRLVCKLAESIAEQRTLWSLRTCSSASLQHPAGLPKDAAKRILDDLLAHARRHHGRWLLADLVLMLAAVVLTLVPGPNLLGFYFLFRVIGHLQSWRGARQAIDKVTWSFEPSAELDELMTLVDVPRAARASRVADVARRLNLPRLTAFFERVAVR
jgi:hypothetical protein